jgi:ATP-dependent Clp protease adaptor protein ClpS
MTKNGEPNGIQMLRNLRFEMIRTKHKSQINCFTPLPRLSSSAHDPNAASGEGTESGTVTIAEPKIRIKTPPMYRVILMNDDFTPMEFVIHVLQKFFAKELEEATRIMLQIHTQGSGLCGVFTFEIAETKVYQVNQFARQNRHPLKCVMEKSE